MVREVENNDLSAAKQANVAVLDFNATWCGPCKMLAPVLAEVSEELTDVEFYGVDVDENRQLAEDYGIQSVPSLVILRNGKKVNQKVGFAPKEDLIAFVKSAY